MQRAVEKSLIDSYGFYCNYHQLYCDCDCDYDGSFHVHDFYVFEEGAERPPPYPSLSLVYFQAISDHLQDTIYHHSYMKNRIHFPL